MTELEFLIALNSIPGLGSIRIRKLVECFGSAENVLRTHPNDLPVCGCLPEEVIQNIVNFPVHEFIQNETALMQKENVKALSYLCEGYPKRLLEIHDFPIVLYSKGDLTSCNELSVAIVGSRRASAYGLSVAQKLSMQLSELGITIVSGLARGVDTAAHQGCLKTGGKTIAVLGCGLSHMYPPENKDLARKISENGAVVSEFSMQTPPVAVHFPKRNRIISGLSLGVVVAEASLKSGALITSQCALEHGREVFAIPGPIYNSNSSGVNRLIQQGAKLVSDVQDILEELHGQLKGIRTEQTHLQQQPNKRNIFQGLNNPEKEIFQILENQPMHIDELVERFSMNVPQMTSYLTALEMKQCIKQLPGQMYIINN